MRKTFYLKNKTTFDKFSGLFTQNPVLERGIILAPVVVAAYNYVNSLILGISFVLITFFSILISSFIPKKIPYTIRTIIYTLIASGIFIPVAMCMEYLFPEQVFRLGVFLPLLIANSLIVRKSETRFHKKKKSDMIIDLFCNCAGFFLVILFVGILRGFLIEGAIFGKTFENMIKVPAVSLPFSGFIIVGFLAAFVNLIKNKLNNPKDKEEIRKKRIEEMEKGL